jgi:hypothetical protein
MKANEAPEKIYLDADENWHRTHTAYTEKAKGNDIEYIRADAFIDNLVEKAWNWIEDNILSSNQQDKSRFYYEQFINHIKGV